MNASPNQTIAVRAALFALRCYKAYFSVLFAGTCRYEPTCSQYAFEAIERFGVSRGVWLGVKRLLRCHPFTSRFGHDPVPEKWEFMETGKYRQDAHDGRSLPSSGQTKDQSLHGQVRP